MKIHHSIRAGLFGVLWFIFMYVLFDGAVIELAMGAIFAAIFMSFFFQWMDVKREERVGRKSSEGQKH